ncbi:MAG TPA: aldo/keto reductase [Candidatus Baltobacteraceae bacterium]|nr:aldo/keto reductase [Candidatus Baltobacteraceae bacterium]
MKQRMLGAGGPLVSEIGLGTMGMSEFYGAADEAESIRTIHRALERGVTLLDTADVYGPYKNEELVGRALAGRRQGVFLCTKFGIVRDPSDPLRRGINGNPDYVRRSIDASLARLGTDYVDLYYQHRVDKDTPIEETVGAMAELITAGKVRYIGLSEAAAATIRRAAKVYEISAVQSEYSLFTRDPEDNGVLATLRELGIALVAYSPLGRGFLSGKIRSLDDLDADDFRRNQPRFQGENFAKNLVVVDRVREVAAELGATPSQVALAWVLAQGEEIVPIPGTKHVERLEENVAAANLVLSPEQLRRIEDVAPKGAAAGDRYPDMSFVNR